MEVQISADILKWAKDRVNLTNEELAQKVNVKIEKLRQWEQGEAFPSYTQAKRLAQKLMIPFGYFFISEIPEKKLPISDFRKSSIQIQYPLNPGVREVVNDAIRKQDWYREYQLASSDLKKLDFIGKYSENEDYLKIAENIASLIGINIDLRNESCNWSEYLTFLTRQVEEQGILVLRSGIVGSNTHRQIPVRECRGFSLSDSIAPLIFINSQDAIAGRIFTLVHELAHLWLGLSGISDSEYLEEPDHTVAKQFTIEHLCDRVAAEILVPTNELLAKQPGNLEIEIIDRLARYFKVSTLVIIRRGLDLNIIDKSRFSELYNICESRQKPVIKSSGGDYYTNIFSRNSLVFTQAVIIATYEGRLLYRDAASLLNVKVNKLSVIADKLSI